MTKNVVERLLIDFWNYRSTHGIEIYNEFSFQHELGIYLRNNCPEYKVQFERNVEAFGIEKSNTVKKEIDIVIFNGNDPLQSTEKYAIELKYPKNGQHPEEMFSFITDIRFLEELNSFGFNGGFAFVLVDDHKFYSTAGNLKKDDIYAYYRNVPPVSQNLPIHGTIQKPTGDKDAERNIDGYYTPNWQPTGCATKHGVEKYHLITI